MKTFQLTNRGVMPTQEKTRDRRMLLNSKILYDTENLKSRILFEEKKWQKKNL